MKRLFCVLLFFCIIISCQLNPFIGVGQQVDTVAPVLNISSHENFQYVSGNTLNLYGTCSDNLKVTSTFLKVEYKDKLLFTWEIKNPVSLWSYQIRLNPKADINAQLKAGIAAEEFELPDGEYKFTVFAHDANDNTSNNSYDTRTLVVDNEPSVVEITYPPLKTSLTFYTGEQQQTEGKTVTVNAADPYDFNNSEYFRNGDFYIQGNIDDNYGVASLTLTLTEYDESNNPTGKALSVSLDSSMELKVKTTIDKLLLTVDTNVKPTSLWNWKILFRETAETEADKMTPRYYKVDITVKDSAGNEESSEKGFLCVLPKMDYPYTIFPKYGDKIPVGTPLSGTCYDDDGIKSVKLSLCNVSGDVIAGKEDLYSEEIAGANMYTWKMGKSIPATGGAYVLKVEVVDINGKESSYMVNKAAGDYIHDAQYRERALTVVDLTAPSVDIRAKQGAKEVDFDIYSDVVDESGNFQVSVKVTDASQVRKVYLARVLASAVDNAKAKLNEIDPISGNVKRWDLSSDVPGINFYNLYEYSVGEKALSQVTSSQAFNVYTDFENEYDVKRFYVYAENASGKTTVSSKSLLKEEDRPQIMVSSPLQGSTLTVPFNISLTVDDFTGIEDLTIKCSQNKKRSWEELKLPIKEGANREIAIDKLSSEEFGNADDFDSGSCTLTFTAKDYYGNCATEKLQFYVDKDDPYVRNITVSKGAATYKTDDTISILMEMSKQVSVSNGTPTLTLNNDGTAYYSKVDGNYLIFNYKVENGQDTEHLNCTQLNLNGAKIVDDQNMDMETKNFPATGAGSLEANAIIKIDTKLPTVSSIKSLTANGSYKAGDVIEIQVTFSENVEIDTTNGNPKLVLNIDGRYAEYDPSHSGNGKDKAVFVYTVSPGDNGNLAWTRWDKNGSVITDSATGAGGKGNKFAFGESDNWQQKLVIDTTSPQVEKIESSFTSNNLSQGGCFDGIYYYCNEGKYISLDVTFSEVVKVSGTPSLSLNLSGSSTTTAVYSSGSGSKKLNFTYTVAAGDNTKTDEILKITKINGVIKDNAGNELTGELSDSAGKIKDKSDNDKNKSDNDKNLKIDTQAPQAPVICTTKKADANNTAGVAVYTGLTGGKTDGVTIKTNGEIAADTYSYCWEENGITDSYSKYENKIEKTFGKDENEGFYQEYSVRLRLKDKAGNESEFSTAQIFVIDTDKPKLTKASSSAVINNKLETSVARSYTGGEKIHVSLVFNKEVTANGVKVKLNNGKEVSLATSTTHITGSADYYLSGVYTVGKNEQLDESLKITDVIAGKVTDCLNNTLDYQILDNSVKVSGFENINDFQEIKIDSVAPKIMSVSSSTTDGWYTVGKIISITVKFSEPVEFVGTNPTLMLSNNASAQYVSGSGNLSWIFNYEVKSDEDTGDSSKDTSSYLKASKITGEIRDLAGEQQKGNLLTDAAIPAQNNFNDNKIGIDTKPPASLGLEAVYSEDNKTVENGKTVSGKNGSAYITVSCASQETGAVVYITENGEIKSNWEATPAEVKCQPENGEVLTYTITAKQRDKAGNISEESSITFTIDNSPIILESITTTHSNGQCKSGDKIELSLNFNKKVRVESRGALTLNATTKDGVQKKVSIEAASEANTVKAVYTVADGDITTEVLNVSELEGKVTDELGTSLELNKEILSTVTNLAATKQITIDTKAPVLQSITSSADDGWYNDAGGQIAVTLTFNEDVKIGSEKPELEMSSGGSAVYYNGNGQTMNFIYTVAKGNSTGTAQNLKVTEIKGNISDMAGNAFNNKLDSVPNFNAKNIGIDTQIGKISITSGGTSPNGKSFLESQTLGISGLADSGSGIDKTECMVNGEAIGLTVTNGTAELLCKAINGVNTSYTVEVKVTDKAGNVSSEKVNFTIDGEEIQLESITTTIGSGTYKAGTKIPITLTFNKEVKVTEALTLTLSNGKKSSINVNNSYSRELGAYYTVNSGDDYQLLNVTGVTGKVEDSRPKLLDNFDLRNVITITDTRTINIDTVVPTITGITTTADGWYNVGKNIRFTVGCSEIVNVIGTPVLNLSSGGKAEYISGSGSKNLVFNYTVAAGNSTGTSQSLNISSFSGIIQDIAKNDLQNLASPESFAIGIDTVAPGRLTISGIDKNSTVTNAQNLKISGFGETGGSGIKNYTININGTPYDEVGGNVSGTLAFDNLPQNIKDKLTVASGGKQSFAISVYQTDNAGNSSAVSDTLNFSIDTNKAKLVSVMSSKNNQICKENEQVEISLVFSRPVTGSLAITLSNGVKLTSGSWSTDSMTYTAAYKIGNSSSEDTGGQNLTITEITGTIDDSLELQSMGNLWSKTDTTKDLSSYKVIVDTIAPTGTGSGSYDDSTGTATLTYTFSENISKVAGKKVTLKRDAKAAPIVLSVSEYNELYALSSSIGTYYEKTINGWANNKVDSTAKYVLKYKYEPTESNLVNIFKSIGYYTQEIVMESSAVTISGKTVTVKTNKLMTGESYTVTADSGIVKDSVGHSCASIGEITFTSGNKPQAPVIRVNKISGRGTTADSTTMRIDTVTDGATIKYSMSSSFTSSPATSYVGNDSVTWRGQEYNGVKISSTTCISAKAEKGGASSDVSYEKAFKTVIKTAPTSTPYTNNGTIQFYVFRGGDQSSGSNSVSGFPMTWDEKSVPSTWGNSTVGDYLEKLLAEYGMLLAENKTATTWGVTEKLYFHGLGCKVSGGKLVWKWQEQAAISVPAGGTETDTNKLEAKFHDRAGANID